MAKRVLIVGGGSAGWITATYLENVLNSDGVHAIDVTLLEPEGIGRIGVGEATVPSLRHTVAAMGISERDYMRNYSWR